MLRDLEEMLLRIENAASRAYMREAVLCYHGGAYRAAVVISVAAGMDDLRRKLNSVASSGGASATIKAADALVDGRFKNQEAYEGTLLDQALAIDLVTPAEEKKLRTILSTRHLCGHPSGHDGSPEEARAAIAAMIDLIMSRPAMLGMTAVTDLMVRVVRPNFFPKPDADAVRKVVSAELKVVSPANYPGLISRLIAATAELAEQRRAVNSLEWKLKHKAKAAALDNLILFLWTVLQLEELRAETWKRLDKLIDQPGAEECCLSILSGSDGPGFQSAPALHRMRALALVRRHIDNAAARQAVQAWHQAGALAEDEIEDVRVALRALARDRVPSPELTEVVFDLPWADAILVYLESLVEGARSGTWNVANPSITTMQALSVEQAAQVTQAQRVRYLKNVARNSIGAYGAHAAKTLMANGLGPRTDFGSAIAQQLADDPTLVVGGEKTALAALLEKSGLADVAAAVSAIPTQDEWDISDTTA